MKTYLVSGTLSVSFQVRITVPAGPLKFDKEGNCIQLPKGWIYATTDPHTPTKEELEDFFNSLNSSTHTSR